jgi:type III restriction enzyme
VLQPSDANNYYETRELVPPEMLPEIRRAEIVITNYHAFQHRETLVMPKVSRSFMQGNGPKPLKTTETDAEMLERACKKLLNYDRVNVINDEAHHCYRHKVGADAEGALTGEDKKEAADNEEAARLWINGIEALGRKLSKGVRAVYDLSATPFFLRGSGYDEGTLFPWVVSDFSLMDAIESGIVKLPRVPVTDNLVQTDTVVYRDLWKHISKGPNALPKSATSAAKLSPFDLPNTLKTALNALYSHYEGEFERSQHAGIEVPPVFIVVCQNTAISKLVFEWIAGFERGNVEEGERAAFHPGQLELFRNYDDQGRRLARPRTLLIDSRQIEAGDALDKGFRDAAGPEIEAFKREFASREGAASAQGETSEGALLREVMNTVGRAGRLGEQIRCVVSVSMLTEGWDTNTVTHILGVRAFGTQLLCEQVVGRGLRRQSYVLNPETGLFDVEYADIMGIPFDFTTSPQKTKPVTRVHAIKERGALEIVFPRVSGYRRDLPSDKLEAVFNEDSRLVITTADIGPTSIVMEGIVGAGVTITPLVLERLRPSEISFNLAKHLLYACFRDEDGFPKQHLFPQIQRLARRWIDEGYLVPKGVPIGAILYPDQLACAAEKIDIACTRASEGHILAVLDPYNPKGSTRHVNFITSKPCWKTGAQPPKCHISHVVLDSSWEEQLALTLETHPRVLAYAKNQAMGFEIPYLDRGINRRYVPDFLVRLNDGGDQPLNLVLEVKGQRDESDKAKAQTTRDLWVPGVNALGGFGRWGFAEFRDWAVMDEDFAALVNQLLKKVAA